MPPLVVPITVSSGLNCRSCFSASPSAAMIICEARCSRWSRRPALLPSRCSSATWPAVLHRHRSTQKRVTGLMQSRAERNASRVSAKPRPSGLTTPAATTATRAGRLFPSEAINVDISAPLAPQLLLLSTMRHHTNGAHGKQQLGGLSVGVFQWRFETR